MAAPLSTVSRSTVVCAAATALPFPPVRAAGVEDLNSLSGLPPEFDLELRGSTTIAVTAARLLRGRLATLVIADDTADTVDVTDNEFDMAAHGFLAGDGPLRISSSGTMPGGLAAGTDYYIVYVNSGSVGFARTRAEALAGTKIDITSAGSGTITVADTADTKRVRWSSAGLLGDASDGAISLAATLPEYVIRVEHAPGVVAYALMATLSAGNVSAELISVTNA